MLAEALVATRAIGDNTPRSYALANLAPYLPKEERTAVLAEALATACAIENPRDRSYALANLASHLPEELQIEALAAARAIKDNSTRAPAVVNLAPYLSEGLLVEALAFACNTWNFNDRSQMLVALTMHLVQIPPTTLTPLLVNTLHDSVSCIRSFLLSDLCCLLPALEVLAAPGDLAAIAQAIVDVGRWWP